MHRLCTKSNDNRTAKIDLSRLWTWALKNRFLDDGSDAAEGDGGGGDPPGTARRRFRPRPSWRAAMRRRELQALAAAEGVRLPGAAAGGDEDDEDNDDDEDMDEAWSEATGGMHEGGSEESQSGEAMGGVGEHMSGESGTATRGMSKDMNEGKGEATSGARMDRPQAGHHDHSATGKRRRQQSKDDRKRAKRAAEALDGKMS